VRTNLGSKRSVALASSGKRLAMLVATGTALLGLALTGCSGSQPAAPAGGSGGGSPVTATQTRSCTEQLDYTGDPRSNAEINSIGTQTGKCPPPQPKATQTRSCTDQLDYTGDPRSNAEINSIGTQTGKCPPPQH